MSEIRVYNAAGKSAPASNNPASLAAAAKAGFYPKKEEGFLDQAKAVGQAVLDSPVTKGLQAATSIGGLAAGTPLSELPSKVAATTLGTVQGLSAGFAAPAAIGATGMAEAIGALPAGSQETVKNWLQQIRQSNPGEGDAAEIAAMGATMAIGGGANAMKAAGAAMPKVANAAATSSILVRAAMGAKAATSTIGRVLTSGPSRVLASEGMPKLARLAALGESTLIGGTFGAGQGFTEDMLGPPGLAAETALAHTKEGFQKGLAFGAGLHLGMGSLGVLFGAGEKLLGWGVGRLTKTADIRALNEAASAELKSFKELGLGEGDVRRLAVDKTNEAFGDPAAFRKEAGRLLTEEGAVLPGQKIVQGLDAQANAFRLQEGTKLVGQKIGKTYEQLDAAVDRHVATVPTLADERPILNNVLVAVQDEIAKLPQDLGGGPLSDPTLYKLKVSEQRLSSYAHGAPSTFAEAHTQMTSYPNDPPIVRKFFRAEIEAATQRVKDALPTTLKGGVTQTFNRLKDLNNKYYHLADLNVEAAQSRAATVPVQETPNLVKQAAQLGVSVGMGGGTSIAGRAATSSIVGTEASAWVKAEWLRSVRDKMAWADRGLQRSLDGFFRPEALPVRARGTAAGILQNLTGLEDKHKATDRFLQEYSKLASQPSLLQQRVASLLEGAEVNAPTVAGEIAQRAATAMGILQEIMPQRTRDTLQPLLEKPFSASQIAALETGLTAIFSPMTAFQRALDGQATIAEKRILERMWPQLTEALKSDLRERLAAHDKPLSARQQNVANSILGTTDGRSVLNAQKTYIVEQPAPKPSGGGKTSKQPASLTTPAQHGNMPL